MALNFFVAASPCAAGEFFLRNQDTVVKTGESITTQHLYNSLKADFANLPIDKRLTGPLFWQHGESDSTLKTYIDRMVDAGSGHFTIESRPHPDWLGPEWYADCKVILDYAKTKGLGGYIFDERLFPSFQVAGRVPAQHRTKVLACSNTDQTGPSTYSGAGYSGNAFIKAIAGKVVNGQIDAGTLTDLATSIDASGALSWNVPTGSWRIFKFTWGYQGSNILDLTTQSAADWFVATVVKPHYDNTGATNILGFFYDEPEYHGTWGLGMENDSPDWKQIMVSRFATLSGEDQGKATYEYWETLGERLGRVGYGTYANYLRSKGGKLIGHDNEERPKGHPLDHGIGPINLMEKQKYQDIPGIDMVCRHLLPRRSSSSEYTYWDYQLPKLASSIAITNNLPGHYAMNEIFGGYGWEFTYPDRRWIADMCQVHGVNVLIPHAFDPKGDKSNPDGDYPPFYYYTGDEANWPNYKAWCERQNRLGYMLSGNDSDNYSIAPVAVLWPGYSKYVDTTWDDTNCYPYNLQSALDRVHYDHQLLTYNRFESTAAVNAATKQIELYKSRYSILVLPPVQYIQYATLAKAKQFYDNGGTVIAWQRVPTRSAKFGNTDAEIQILSTALWNSTMPTAAATPIKTNANGGKTYFISGADETTITSNLRNILNNSGINSDFRITNGTFDEWTGYCHRKRNGMDVFMVWNGAVTVATITARFQATGDPELWNPTTKAVTSLAFTRVSLNEVDIELSIPAEESYLVVFKPRVVANHMNPSL